MTFPLVVLAKQHHYPGESKQQTTQKISNGSVFELNGNLND